MGFINLRRIDLNLLVILDVLLEERHVTRAADRLALTQSSTSGALSRLRSLFDDALMVRQPTGMVLTPLAQSIQEPLRGLMLRTGELLGSTAAFEPRGARRTIRIGMPDYASLVFLPRLMASLNRKAPPMDLLVQPTSSGMGSCKELESGKLDIVIAAFPEVPDHLRKAPLCEDPFVCLMRRNHPAAGEAWTLQVHDAYPGIIISGLNESARLRCESSPALSSPNVTVPHYLMVPALLRETNAIATVPRRLASMHAAELTTRPVPVATRPLLYQMAWHPRSSADPASAWLRTEIRDIAQEEA